ncbi:hypothetical protein FS749_004847 [Ceratobasidium sp. UAMH 11750]|nr:hypothetical protein FS749_004847 [Ceratobasidium sp. UAMH 11750]
MAPTALTRSPSTIQTGPRPFRTTLRRLRCIPPRSRPSSDRIIKACTDRHARKRKDTGIGGPSCGTATHALPAPNGVALGSSARPSPHGGTPTICASRAPIVAAASVPAFITATARMMPQALKSTPPDDSIRTDHESDLIPRSRSSHSSRR